MNTPDSSKGSGLKREDVENLKRLGVFRVKGGDGCGHRSLLLIGVLPIGVLVFWDICTLLFNLQLEVAFQRLLSCLTFLQSLFTSQSPTKTISCFIIVFFSFFIFTDCRQRLSWRKQYLRDYVIIF